MHYRLSPWRGTGPRLPSLGAWLRGIPRAEMCSQGSPPALTLGWQPPPGAGSFACGPMGVCDGYPHNQAAIVTPLLLDPAQGLVSHCGLHSPQRTRSPRPELSRAWEGIGLHLTLGAAEGQCPMSSLSIAQILGGGVEGCQPGALWRHRFLPSGPAPGTYSLTSWLDFTLTTQGWPVLGQMRSCSGTTMSFLPVSTVFRESSCH